MAVHAYASWDHYADHMVPIWKALPESERGQFIVNSAPLRSRLAGRGVNAEMARVNGKTAEGLSSREPIMVAGFSDLQKLKTRPIVFVEHGAGQTYFLDDGRIHGGYSGGEGRRKAGLFLCPNRMVAANNLSVYPEAEVAVVGSPRLDDLFEWRASSEYPPAQTIGFSFHWDCRVCPESGSAFTEHARGVSKFAQSLGAYGMGVIGHGHPKAWSDLKPWWESNGVEAIGDWGIVASVIDAYVVDNSSTIFEAAALDIPVVLLNSKRWRRTVNHGTRFWNYADIGPSVDPDGDLHSALSSAFEAPWGERREEVVKEIYEVAPGLERLASRYAAEAILDWISREKA